MARPTSRVGVLAIQGDYAAHGAALERAGATWFEARTSEDIESADAMILPGGESTVIGGLLLRFGLLDALAARIAHGMPVFGTCAGLILLAKRVEGRQQPGLRVLDATVVRNAYGRQIDSFRARVATEIPGAEEIEAVFIRAPKIKALGSGVEVLARHEGDPVIVRQGNILGCTFHPELVEGAAVHRWFLEF
jgi:5'-phosphate synthase pdxT subunit